MRRRPQETEPAALAETRRLVEDALTTVLGEGALRPTARIKQLRSIIEKLNRLPTRLVQLQDVVGLRAVVPDLAAQDAVVAVLTSGPSWTVRDHRIDAPHGYRAVHAIRRAGRYRVEVQIRTPRQQYWADLVEAMDRTVPGLKYGTAPPEAQDLVAEFSRHVAQLEGAELAGHEEEAKRLSRELLLGNAVAALMI
jgi:ppGpp synthetase/RelA/SpoT-type nucleotidyltranferase